MAAGGHPAAVPRAAPRLGSLGRAGGAWDGHRRARAAWGGHRRATGGRRRGHRPAARRRRRAGRCQRRASRRGHAATAGDGIHPRRGRLPAAAFAADHPGHPGQVRRARPAGSTRAAGAAALATGSRLGRTVPGNRTGALSRRGTGRRGPAVAAGRPVPGGLPDRRRGRVPRGDGARGPGPGRVRPGRGAAAASGRRLPDRARGPPGRPRGGRHPGLRPARRRHRADGAALRGNGLWPRPRPRRVPRPARPGRPRPSRTRPGRPRPGRPAAWPASVRHG